MKRELAWLNSLRSLLASASSRRPRWVLLGGTLLVFVAVLVGAFPPVPTTGITVTATPTPWSARVAAEGRPALPTYTPEGESILVTEPDWPALLLDLGSKLLLTVGLVYVFLYLLRRYMARTAGQRRPTSIAVVETVHLGQHRTLHLVRVGSQLILLGATSSQISLLAEISEPVGSAAAETPSLPAESSFHDRLRSLTST